jgi:DNA repair protein RadC
MKRRKVYKRAKSKPYKLKNEMIYSGLGGIPKDFIPEVKIRYNRGKMFLGKISSSFDVAEFLRKTYERGKLQLQEAFVVLFLNQQNEIIGYYKHSVGSINATIADVRIIFAAALSSLSTSMILAHNHPSGNTKPSEADKTLTAKIKEAGKLFDITVLDHIILTKNSYYSFADEGLI